MSTSGELSIKPVLLPKKQKRRFLDRFNFGELILQRQRRPLLNLALKVGAQVEITPLKPEELLRYIHLRHRVGQIATEKESSVLGHIWNKISGASPYYAQLPGRIILAAYEWIGGEAPAYLMPNEEYLLRIDVAGDLSAAVKLAYSARNPKIGRVR